MILNYKEHTTAHSHHKTIVGPTGLELDRFSCCAWLLIVFLGYWMPKFSISTSIFRIISLVTVLTIFVGATVFEVSNAYAEVQFGEETPASAETTTTVSPTVTSEARSTYTPVPPIQDTITTTASPTVTSEATATYTPVPPIQDTITTTVSPTVTSEATSTYTPVPPIQDTITTTASPTVTSEATATHTPVPSVAPDYCSMSQSQFNNSGDDVINRFLGDCGDKGESKKLCRTVARQVEKELKISRASLTRATMKIFADPAPAKPPVYRPISPKEGMEIIKKACRLKNESGFPCRLSDYNVRTWCCQHQSYTAVTAAQANGLVACQIEVPDHVLAAIEVSIDGKTETLVFESMSLTPIGYIRKSKNKEFHIEFLPGYRGTQYTLDSDPICKRPNTNRSNNGFLPPFPNPGPNDTGAKYPFEIDCLNAVKQVTGK